MFGGKTLRERQFQRDLGLEVHHGCKDALARALRELRTWAYPETG